MRRVITALIAAVALVLTFGIATAGAKQGDEHLPCTLAGHWILSPATDSEVETAPTFDGLTYDKTTGKAIHYLSGPVDAINFAEIAQQHDNLKLSHCIEEDSSSTEEPSPSATPTPTPVPTPTPEPSTTPTPTPTASQPASPSPSLAPNPVARATPDSCLEDEPCWDCETMGNGVCGPIDLPNTAVPYSGIGGLLGDYGFLLLIGAVIVMLLVHNSVEYRPKGKDRAMAKLRTKYNLPHQKY